MKQSYKTKKQSIWRLVALTRMFSIGLLLCKYPCNHIIRYFVPVIQIDCNNSCRLAYEVD